MRSDEYYYEFGGEMGEEFAMIVLGVVGVVAIVALVLSIVIYVFQSIGLYSIAKRRGIQNPWLAWLPVGNYWIAGSLSDQYRYVVCGEVKNKRMILLLLSLVGMVLSGLASGISGSALVETLEYIAAEDLDGVVEASRTGLGGTLVSLAQSGVQIASLIFWHMALYDLYTSCDPKNNVLFLVLGIIFGITVPFFIFANRKKDLGMPPRKPQPDPYQPAPQPRTYREPWDDPEQ